MRLGDDRARFGATWGLWITTHGGGQEDEERLRHLGDLVEIADRVADPELSLQAHHSAWATLIWGGEFVRSQDHVRQGTLTNIGTTRCCMRSKRVLRFKR